MGGSRQFAVEQQSPHYLTNITLSVGARHIKEDVSVYNRCVLCN